MALNLFFPARNYQQLRLDILMNSQGKPEGGKWSFDDQNRKPFPKDKKVVAVEELTDKFSRSHNISFPANKCIFFLFYSMTCNGFI